jgi:hypothetical protein
MDIKITDAGFTSSTVRIGEWSFQFYQVPETETYFIGVGKKEKLEEEHTIRFFYCAIGASHIFWRIPS